MNWLDWILIGVLALGAGLAIRAVLRNKRSGCSGCCADCRRAGGCGAGTKETPTPGEESS